MKVFNKKKMPFVYIVNPFNCNFIKIGKWKTTLSKLQGRYHTYYGKNIEIYAYEVQNYDELEVLLKDKLLDYTLDPRCELLKKCYLKHYQSVFKHYCKTNYISCEKKPSTIHVRIRNFSHKIITHQNLLKLFNVDNLDSLIGKKIERHELFSLSEDIQNLFIIARDGRLVRNQRCSGTFTLKNCSETLSTIMKIFDLSFKRGRRKATKIKGKNVDLTPYFFSSLI